MYERNITLEEVEVQEGNHLCSYDAEIEVHYSIEQCESDTHRGTKTWEEVNVEDMFLVSFYKFVEEKDEFDNVMFVKSSDDMPKETWEIIQQQVLDESSEFIFDH